jgi:hypothetical protein
MNASIHGNSLTVMIPSSPGADSAGSTGACYITRRSGGAA